MLATPSSDPVGALHALCAIYTRRPVAESMLDAIGWTSHNDLRNKKLLEPCAGDGALLTVAVERLLASPGLTGGKPDVALLEDRIAAFELEPIAAEKARTAIRVLLARHGLQEAEADGVARAWVRTEDFLTSEPSPASHVVANPPYVRWSRVPKELASRYVAHLGKDRARGDLSIAFLHAIADRLGIGGEAAVLCTDRWLYSQAGEGIRARLSSEFELTAGEPVDDRTAFVKEVLAYPIIMRMRRSTSPVARPLALLGTGLDQADRTAAHLKLRDLQRRFGTIEQAGCRIKVGPALGCEPAFVFDAGTAMVETELLRPYVKPSELVGNGIAWTGRCVARVNGDGGWINLDQFPRMRAHLERYRSVLEKRTCVASTSVWYRTIDLIDDEWTSAPKVLIPELSNKPRACLDETGYVPSHGIYAVLSKEWPVRALHAVLSNGLLDLLARSVAPVLRGRSFRLYRRFLVQLPLPAWSSVDPLIRNDLEESERAGAAACKLFELEPPR